MFARLPTFELDIQSFNTNFTPLHSIKPEIIGAVVGGRFIIDPLRSTDWIGGIGWLYGHEYGSDNQIISSFAPGQLPTIFSLDGTGGIGLNNNSRFKLDIDHYDWKLSGEVGYQMVLPSGVIDKLYAGIFYRHSDIRYKTNIDTDFSGGTFFSSVDECVKQD